MKPNFIQEIFNRLINTGHSRTIKAKKNILASFFIKGSSIIIGFLLVPIALNYLDQTRYGIWITISSFLTWFTFFEIGLGSGLRNKLAEALAVKDFYLGRIYVSTTYAILTLITCFVAILFFVINKFINWSIILNTDENLSVELNTLAGIVFGFFFLRFVIKLVGNVLLADQRPAINNLFGPLGNLIALVVIYILTKTTQGSLLYLGLTLSISPVLVLAIATIYFYSTDYKNLAPSWKFVRFQYAKDLLNLGVKFFIIRIAGLIMYQSSNIIISQYFGPAEVTPYNIAYKYFSMIDMLFLIIIMPYWSAYTEAWVIKDIKWIKTSIRKLIYVWMLISFGGIVMLVISPFFYKIWVGEEIQIPFELSTAFMVYFITLSFGGIFNMFINGIGKIRLQMYGSIAGSILFISIAIISINYLNLGLVSLVIASIISNFYGIILAPIQYKLLINSKAKGIWDK